MLNPVFFVSRAILVALAATVLVVALKAIAYIVGIENILNDVTIGLIFAAGLAFAGARWGHQHAKRSTTPLALEVRIFLLQFAILLFILSSLQFNFGTVTVFGIEFPAAGVYIPALVAMWVIYWCMKNVLTMSEEQANMVGTKRSELFVLCAGVLLAPFLLLVPGFALAEVIGFDPEIVLSVFQYAPIMSAALPIAFSVRKLVIRSK